jgi:hypothetical protein
MCIDRAIDTALCGGLTEVLCPEAIKLDITMAQGVPGADTAGSGAAAPALLSRVP